MIDIKPTLKSLYGIITLIHASESSSSRLAMTSIIHTSHPYLESVW